MNPEMHTPLGPLALLAAGVLVASFLVIWAMHAWDRRKRKAHVHTADSWDGYYEHCRCGACAGDRRDHRGMRCISFADWPAE